MEEYLSMDMQACIKLPLVPLKKLDTEEECIPNIRKSKIQCNPASEILVNYKFTMAVFKMGQLGDFFH